VSEERLSRAEKLQTAGVLAPRLRQQSERLSRRKVAVYNQETGEVVRYVSGAEAIERVVAQQLVEFSINEGEKPDHVVCEDCGKVIARRPKARKQRCPECYAFHRQQVTAKTHARPEYRERERVRKLVANLTPEERERRRLYSAARYETASDEKIAKDRAHWREKANRKRAEETPAEREARLAYQREWYARNRETHKANVAARKKAKVTP
jgi:Fe2+ or Zn2+ uptake regulation protein